MAKRTGKKAIVYVLMAVFMACAGLFFKTPFTINILMLSACAVIFIVFRRAARSNKKDRQNVIGSTTDPLHHFPVLSSVQDIELFFLNVFRRQMGATGDAPAKIIPILTQQPDSNQVYDLKVKHHGRWKSRRMTIGPLGEGTGSKSQCFHVVYDNHMVIKIPSAPIKDFDEYVRRIQQEAAIVKKLAPLECIIPAIPMILQKMKIVPDTAGHTSKTLEDMYIRWLKTYPELQNHLKIGDAFAFFMDLSKYRFLGQIMDRLHDIETDIYNVVSADAGIIWDYNEFANKYGHNNDTICFDLQNVYAEFHQGMKNLSVLFDHTDPLSEKEKMKWLLLYLVEKDFVEIPKDLPDSLIENVKSLLNDVSAEHSAVAHSYKNLATEHVRNRSFKRKKSQIEGIVTNLLTLLDWMGQRGVAMRDIKPDNLLVAGDLEAHPLLLASPEDYAIGLIDVETAVAFETEGIKNIKQPQLGGTPLYATPSHFFTNDLLREVHKDVPKVFVLQDWYAVTGIVYELITGEKLFLKAAHTIHNIIQKLRSTGERERRMPKVYWNINRTFWQTAMKEFGKKVDTAEHKLSTVHVTIPDNFKQWFKHYWARKRKEIAGQSTTIDSLENGAVKMSAYVLLETMFGIVMDDMVGTYPDAVKTDFIKNDMDKMEDLPIDSEPERHVLGFTFTV